MITSIDPLRIYVFEGDVLLRFCPEKYHPFDPDNKDKYVVQDDYRPTWEVPTLAKLYSDLDYTFRYMKTRFFRPNFMYSSKIEEELAKIFAQFFPSPFHQFLLEVCFKTQKCGITWFKNCLTRA